MSFPDIDLRIVIFTEFKNACNDKTTLVCISFKLCMCHSPVYRVVWNTDVKRVTCEIMTAQFGRTDTYPYST